MQSFGYYDFSPTRVASQRPRGGGVGCPTGAICPRCPSVSRLPRPRDMVPGPLPHQDHAHRTRNRLTTSPPTLVCARNNNSTIKKARLRFFVFLNKKETTQVACFNSHKKGKEPHPAFLHCGIVEAKSRQKWTNCGENYDVKHASSSTVRLLSRSH